MRKTLLIIALAVLLVAGLPLVALAAWSTSSTVNNPICTYDNEQISPELVSDGAGGAIIVWEDDRNRTNGSNYDIYAQRVDSSGNTLWTDSGKAICTDNTTEDSDQSSPMLVSDGASGAIIVWDDLRHDTISENASIYAQRVDASGVTLWTANGTAICTEIGEGYLGGVVSDGSGGAIITWSDQGRSWPYTDIYAQRVDSSGNALWADNGTVICTYTQNQEYPELVSDGASGAIIVWEDYRSTNIDIYAQRVDSSGNTLWTDNGTAVSNISGTNQFTPKLAPDGWGTGAIIVWHDDRTTVDDYDIYAQRVDLSGNTIWTDNGTAICTATNNQDNPQLVSNDDFGGAVIAWEDNRAGNNVYAQLVDIDGNTQWTDNGTAICTANEPQENLQLVPDGTGGGAIIVWEDERNMATGDDIYAQWVDANGSTQWTTDGTAICTAPNTQGNPQLIPDGVGSAIIAWQDERTDVDYDIYAQRVDASGTLGSPTTPVNDPVCTETGNQQNPQLISDGSGGAIIVWEDLRIGYDIYAQRVDSSGSHLWTDNGTAICTKDDDQTMPKLVSDGSGGVIIAWQDERGADSDIYAQRVNSSGSPQWTDNGTLICNAASWQLNPQIVSDGSGGAFIAWVDNRHTVTTDNISIYIQRVDADGNTQLADNGTAIRTRVEGLWIEHLKMISDGDDNAIIVWVDDSGVTDIYAQLVNPIGDALWTDNGTAVCGATGTQEDPQLVSDGYEGAIIVWKDFRGADADIYAQHIPGGGVAQWTADGIPICTVEYPQLTPKLVSDGAGGAIIAWHDDRNLFNSGNYDIYAQHIDASGSALWTDNGTAISNVIPSYQVNTNIVSDGAGGAIIVWQDERNESSGVYDIYAQRVDENGSAQWTGHGTAISIATNSQEYPELVSDGDEGAIIVWKDRRNNPIANNDIYAQRVDASGTLGWEAPAPPAEPPAEGGGGGIPSPPPGTTHVFDAVTSDGEFTKDVNVESEDGKVELNIEEGTVGLDEHGRSLVYIEANEMEDPPDPPKESNRIGLTYDLEPDGATFDPPVSLTFTYDPDEIPEGVSEENLVIAMWDEEAGEWVDLECTVDPETNTITATVSHFTPFSVVAFTHPAAFETSYLTILPREVDPDETVTIKVKATNIGSLSGSYKVTLKIDNVVVDSKDVTLEGGASQNVAFAVSKDAAGTYNVDVNDLLGTFTVRPAPAVAPAPPVAPPAPPVAPVAPPAPRPPVNWPLIGGIIAAVVVVVLLIYFFVRRKRGILRLS